MPLKIGDKVTVIGGNDNRDICWVDSMNKFKNTKQVIYSVEKYKNYSIYYLKDLKNSMSGYFMFLKEWLKPEPTYIEWTKNAVN